MQSLSERQFAVVGGSAKTWNYTAWMQPQSINQYDANSEALRDIFNKMGVCTVAGADELVDLSLADWIGHVQANEKNERIVFDAYHTWLTICLWTAQDLSLIHI